jgi:hypothetical protein
MKLVKIFLIAILLSFTAFAQFDDDASVSEDLGIRTILFDGDLASTDTLYSKEFKIADCETIFNVYRHYTSASSKPRIRVLRQERFFPDAWTTVDGYSIADSLETYQAARVDTFGTGYPTAMRLVIIGAANNPADTEFEIMIKAKIIYYGKLED